MKTIVAKSKSHITKGGSLKRAASKSTESRPLTPADSKWLKFFKDLAARVKEQGCKKNHAQTLAAMKALEVSVRHYDIKKTLELFEKHGGYCDCEVS